MKKYIVLITLALITMVGAVLEGLIEDLSPQLIQLNGLLTLTSTVALIIWALLVQNGGYRES